MCRRWFDFLALPSLQGRSTWCLRFHRRKVVALKEKEDDLFWCEVRLSRNPAKAAVSYRERSTRLDVWSRRQWGVGPFDCYNASEAYLNRERGVCGGAIQNIFVFEGSAATRKRVKNPNAPQNYVDGFDGPSRVMPGWAGA